MCITEIGTIALYQSSTLSQFKNLVHGFTTRKGGVSHGGDDGVGIRVAMAGYINRVHKKPPKWFWAYL